MSWNFFFFVCSRQNHDNYWQQNANAKSIIQVLTKTWHPNCELVDLSTLLSLNYLVVLHIVYINEYGFFTSVIPPHLAMGASRSIMVIDRGWKKRGQGPKQVNYRIPSARELVWTKNRGEGSVFEVIKRANWQSVKLFPFLAIDGEETSGTCVHARLTKQKIVCNINHLFF